MTTQLPTPSEWTAARYVGAQHLSQGSIHPLRALSDRYIPAHSSVRDAEALAVRVMEGRCACGVQIFEVVEGVIQLTPAFAESEDSFHVDHILPASEGHLAAPGNLQALCSYCNSTLKSNLSNEEYLTKLVKMGVITKAEKREREKRTKLLTKRYYGDFPEAKRFTSSDDILTAMGTVVEVYKLWEAAGRIVKKSNDQYSYLAGRPLYDLLGSLPTRKESLPYGDLTLRDMISRKHNLQRAYDELFPEEDPRTLPLSSWALVGSSYMSCYSSEEFADSYALSVGRSCSQGEFTKAKRTLLTVASLLEREDLAAWVRTEVPGFKKFRPVSLTEELSTLQAEPIGVGTRAAAR